MRHSRASTSAAGHRTGPSLQRPRPNPAISSLGPSPVAHSVRPAAHPLFPPPARPQPYAAAVGLSSFGAIQGSKKYRNMSYFQATMHKPHSMLAAYKPVAGLGRTHELLGRHSMCPHSTTSCKLKQQLYPRLVPVSAGHKRLGPVYASSGKENPDLVNDPFSMESLNKAMAQAKKPRSLQDLLGEQMAKIRGQGSGGNGGNKNRYGGSGGGSDGPEDESFKDSLYEMIQILIATIAFILVYIHIIRGEELYRLARDYTRYLVTGKRTSRLKRAMLNWREFSDNITKKDGAQDDDYDGRSVSSESTWWQQPQQLARRLEEICRGYLRPHAQESLFWYHTVLSA